MCDNFRVVSEIIVPFLVPPPAYLCVFKPWQTIVITLGMSSVTITLTVSNDLVMNSNGSTPAVEPQL